MPAAAVGTAVGLVGVTGVGGLTVPTGGVTTEGEAVVPGRAVLLVKLGTLLVLGPGVAVELPCSSVTSLKRGGECLGATDTHQLLQMTDDVVVIGLTTVQGQSVMVSVVACVRQLVAVFSLLRTRPGRAIWPTEMAGSAARAVRRDWLLASRSSAPPTRPASRHADSFRGHDAAAASGGHGEAVPR